MVPAPESKTEKRASCGIISSAAHSKDAEKEAGEYGLKSQRNKCCTGDDPSHRVCVIQLSPTCQGPLVDGRNEKE
jgi:hypothetical protein